MPGWGSKKVDTSSLPGSRRRSGWRLQEEREFAERSDDPLLSGVLARDVVVSWVQVRHERRDQARGSGWSRAVDAAHRRQSGLELVVVYLNRVVHVQLDRVQGCRQQLVQDPAKRSRPDRW